MTLETPRTAAVSSTDFRSSASMAIWTTPGRLSWSTQSLLSESTLYVEHWGEMASETSLIDWYTTCGATETASPRPDPTLRFKSPELSPFTCTYNTVSSGLLTQRCSVSCVTSASFSDETRYSNGENSVLKSNDDTTRGAVFSKALTTPKSPNNNTLFITSCY
ncbi:hypothetical protein OGAPHI_003124 [Ogataea philodendri]|uniref:Uncharacterized protein n=1 Tax=Ogataea philodendri TaxID=1378263 RepID=A0A9P8T6U8_9ASCO|nr:uncharacterized protein OGAPHI_003124 [Ogataea philodendri]KAH3667475.1 hypothetical protein OGAPHI_003124 [Ogataea philodendri]